MEEEGFNIKETRLNMSTPINAVFWESYGRTASVTQDQVFNTPSHHKRFKLSMLHLTSKGLTVVRFRESICFIVQDFVAIGQTVPEIWRFFDFCSKWQPSAIVDLL